MHRPAPYSLRLSPRWTAVPITALGLLTLVGSAQASDCDNPARLSTCLNVDTLWPHPGAARFQAIGATETTAPDQFSFGLVSSYLYKPLVLRASSANPSGSDIPAVEHQLNANFLWAWGVTDRLELVGALPMTLYQTGTGVSGFASSQPRDLPRSSLRDLRFGFAYALVPRARSLNQKPFGLVARFEIAAPTGEQQWFAGETAPVWMPSVSADWRKGRYFVGAELGARLRQTSNLVGSRLGSQGVVAVGAGADLLPDEHLSLALEAYALPTFVQQQQLSRDPQTQEVLAKDSSRHLIPAEWMATVRSAPATGGDVSLSLSAGTSLPLTKEASMTAPEARVVLGIRYAPLARDTDNDGVLDRDDQCPQAQEDRDGFEDTDGCPDPDNDRDGIPDNIDRCRDKPEDKDGFQDEDGCPDLDDDNDGVPDTQDRCRFKPEDKDNFQDDDGCPDPDNDQDGIPDAKDLCPNAAEDLDGYNDTDGCPDPDNDADGIPDERDKCPTAAEDKDGFQDDDGCPDLDNDQDGVLDTKDRCPLQPETINGVDDADGCPEADGKDLTVVQGASVTVAQPERFAANKATISANMRQQLRMIVQKALGLQPLGQVIVQTFADAPGESARNDALAADRADAIRAVLIEAGLAPQRVTAAVGDLKQKRPAAAPQYEITVQPPAPAR